VVTTRHLRRALVAILIGCIGTTALPTPAWGACVVGYVVVHFEQTPDQVLLQPTQCLVPTPFQNYPGSVGLDQELGEGLLPPGAPSGAGFRVWVPA
jgi:hypothetical protein